MPFIYLGMFVLGLLDQYCLETVPLSCCFFFFWNARTHQREVIIYFRKINLAHVGTKSTLRYWRWKTIRYFDSVHPLIRRIIYLYCPKGKTFHSSFLNPPPHQHKLFKYTIPILQNKKNQLPPTYSKKNLLRSALPGKFYWNSPNLMIPDISNTRL
jgi:hypothetical protein